MRTKRYKQLMLMVLILFVFILGCPNNEESFQDGYITIELVGASEHDDCVIYCTITTAGEVYTIEQTIRDGGIKEIITEERGWNTVTFLGGQQFEVEAFIDVDGDAWDSTAQTPGLDYVANVFSGFIDGDKTVTLKYPDDFEIAAGGAPAISVKIDNTNLFNGYQYELGNTVVDIPLSYNVVITNSGPTTLKLSGTPLVDKSGVGSDMFTVESEPAVELATDRSTSFTIGLEPTTLGIFDVEFRLDSNDTSNNPFIFTICGTVTEAPVKIPRTGQTTSYAARDDGNLQYGVTWPEPRFVDNEDGTTTDMLTGLMWMMTPASSESTWNAALNWASSLDTGGHNDWHIPNVNEFMSLSDAGEANIANALNSSGFFSGIRSDNYWTSTRSQSLSGDQYAWVAWMNDGTLSRLGPPDFAVTYSWAVRLAGNGVVGLPKTGRSYSSLSGDDGELQLGIEWPYPRFIDLGNGVVADYLTGFMWEKAPSSTPMIWSDALEYATDRVIEGYNDWRLPNVNEIRTLMHYNQNVMADWLNSNGFDNVNDGSYWTSTTFPSSVTSAYTISMLAGHVYYAAKTDNRYVWLVRGGE